MSVDPELLQYPELVKVDLQPGAFNSGLLAAKVSRERNHPLTGTTPTKKSWSSVQAGVEPDDHIELNSVLVYDFWHSKPFMFPQCCIRFEFFQQEEWNFRALRDIQPGDELSFFYPSTEWDMDQGFQCRCQAQNCLGYIRGAKELSRAQVVERGFISTYISRLLDRRDTQRI
ncbi:SET (Su(var)3-9, Enhancer-of-zeste, Trithorax) domain [Rhizoctonia solani]|uniref:SET (Su(Var)3-9, Enhancer-of-zeste, Trithorax) domain n=1 Tax=Rhizoctonia solani TaxID=456999 RepID=A0A8H7M8D1_9AGAM|nr:SET (Su(var)3-9, Enhancer-of-zeste, Trithorax) domain [Rhizoctonia solani]